MLLGCNAYSSPPQQGNSYQINHVIKFTFPMQLICNISYQPYNFICALLLAATNFLQVRLHVKVPEKKFELANAVLFNTETSFMP